MNVRRGLFAFLMMLVIAVCAVALIAEKPILESWNALRGLPDSRDWQCVGAGGGKTAAVAGWQNDSLELRYFTTDGEALSTQHVTLPEESTDGTILRLLPVREGLSYLGLYGPNAEKLFLYLVREDGAVERLLAVECSGASFEERTDRTRFSEFLYEDGVMSFALWMDSALECYLCRDGGGLEAVGVGQVEDDRVLSILSMQDGTLLQGGLGCLSLAGQSADTLAQGQAVTHLTQGRGGWYYLDAVRFEVCFADSSLNTAYRVLAPDVSFNGEPGIVTSAALTREESILMLRNGTVLTLTDSEGTAELTGILHASAFGLWLSLAEYAGIALAAALVLWLLLYGLRRGYASLAVLRGSVFIACALLCFAALRFVVLKPAAETSVTRENASVVSSVLQAANAEQRWADDGFVSDVTSMLEGSGRGSNIRIVRAEMADGVWRGTDGRIAAALTGFSPLLADKALQDGTASALQNGTFRYVLAEGTHSLSICMNVPDAPENRKLSYYLLGSFGILSLLALLILAVIGANVRKISRRMERISQGGVPERLKLRTGDELESMASIVNSLGSALKTQEENQELVERSYRRFVPEKVLSLLGKQSIQEVDKSAFAARRMAVMTVRFAFPDALYTDMSNSRLLFDSVNEVMERTASIVARKDGTVFHYAYNGFDLVMDDGGEAVSTAVAIQQEVLSFNETRARSRLPGVTLRIAVDRGNVMLGIVGDASTMTPTTISSSLSIVQELIVLCDRLKAGILCTEAIISDRQDYGSRYMGKCLVGGQPVRVYEVFDGDDFNTRRGKANSINEFSKGVYDLYGGDPVGAKHAFLQLAHSYPLDGGARYYLHLADRLEHDPSLPCVLNMDHTDGWEM